MGEIIPGPGKVSKTLQIHDRTQILPDTQRHEGWGAAQHRGGIYLLLTRQPRVQFSAFPRIIILILLRFIGGMACSGQKRLDNVNQTHPELASGKLVLQNRHEGYFRLEFL